MIDARVRVCVFAQRNNNKTQTAQTHKAGERVAHELLDFWSGAALSQIMRTQCRRSAVEQKAKETLPKTESKSSRTAL